MASAPATPKAQKTRSHNGPQVIPVHNGPNLRKDEQKRKNVFKHVLDSPYTVKWPFIVPEDQIEILEALCKYVASFTLLYKVYKGQNRLTRSTWPCFIITFLAPNCRFLEPIGEYRRQCKAAKPKHVLTRKKRIHDTITATTVETVHVGIPTGPSYASSSSQPVPTPPSVLNSTVFGINQVTKFLERIITASRSSAMTPATPIPDPLTMIFVCKGDIVPPHLVGHLPVMAYIAGGGVKERANSVLLCSLAKGAERRIGGVAGIQRCSAIGVQALNDESYTALFTLVHAKVEPIEAPWLLPLLLTPINSVPKPPYLVTNIKTLQTSAPLAYKKYGERRKRKKEKVKTVVLALPQSRQLQSHPAQSPLIQQQEQQQSLVPPPLLLPSPPSPQQLPPLLGGVDGCTQQSDKRGGSWDNQEMGASRSGSESGRDESFPKKSRYT
ncbi:hypothetical protein BC937DRAFT_94699 [Endogone sp. FLAS-F59071]|nr:hypothetical protein BC937DRAFT_94699 [Endogone sp. FLAS-F59071]|eukprot:RUS20651.1 hypothetical protein BC937DRAFT_94699 [Endogone sp. FLAS-F59071]